MTESYIKSTDGGGTMFAGPDAIELFRVTTLKSAIRLATKGIQATRGFTLTRGLAMATQVTHKKYKRTEAEKAISDLDAWCREMSAALPREQ